jgi:transposase-like protein
VRKHYTPEFKAAVALEALREEKMLSQIASERGVHPTMLSKWKAEAEKGLPAVFRKETAGTDKLKEEYESKIKVLYQQIGKLSTDLEWLKKKSGK